MYEAISLLRDVGVEVSDSEIDSRKLKIKTNRANVDLLVVRAADVPTYVDYGAADIGITGKDILLESDTDGYYEPLDLKKYQNVSYVRPALIRLGQICPFSELLQNIQE